MRGKSYDTNDYIYIGYYSIWWRFVETIIIIMREKERWVTETFLINIIIIPHERGPCQVNGKINSKGCGKSQIYDFRRMIIQSFCSCIAICAHLCKYMYKSVERNQLFVVMSLEKTSALFTL